MQERGRTIVGALVLLLLLFPLGFYLHVSPRFPGSLLGSSIGIAGAVFMLVPFLYVLVKRVPFLKAGVTRYVSMRTLLMIHIYAGVLGPILGVIHSAHKFGSSLGLSLLAMMLAVVLSGYVGRYLLVQIATAVQGRRSELAALTAAFERARLEAAGHSTAPPAGYGILPRWAFRLFRSSDPAPVTAQADRLVAIAEAMADVDHAIRAEDVMREHFKWWLQLHVIVAVVLYGLLAMHVWAGLYYGLRWLS